MFARFAVERAGFRIIKEKGLFLKLLFPSQMAACTVEQLKGMFDLLWTFSRRNLADTELVRYEYRYLGVGPVGDMRSLCIDSGVLIF